jgi:hypothetical protein
MAARIAAHAADIAKGVKGALERDRQMSVARKRLDWEEQARLALAPEKVTNGHSLIGIIIAEIASVILPSIDANFVILGLVLYFVLLVIMIIDAARMDRYHQGQLELTLTLVPLTRIFSLILPLMDIPQMMWYPAIYFPLLVAAIVVARLLGYKPADIGITLRSWGIINCVFRCWAFGW